MNQSQLTTPFGDIVPLPTTVLWGGNGQLSGDPTKVSMGGIVYTFANAVLAQVAFTQAATALKTWNGQSPIDLTPPPSSPISISSVTPNSGVLAGQTVVISGTNLLDSTIQVFVGAVRANVTIVNPSQISVVLPANTPGAAYSVTLVRGNDTSVLSNAIFYGQAFTSVSSATWVVGNGGTILLTGQGFSGLTALTRLEVNDGAGHIHQTSSLTITSDTSITMGFSTAAFPAAGVYTLFISYDGGQTWTSTLLTITAS